MKINIIETYCLVWFCIHVSFAIIQDGHLCDQQADTMAVFILEDVLSIRPVTDSCYASSVKTELNEYRQDELPEANNAMRV